MRWPFVSVVGVLSLVTMPLTAIWFLLLAPLCLVAAAVGAALARSQRRTVDLLSIGASLGLGLLVGPAVYLTLAVVT